MIILILLFRSFVASSDISGSDHVSCKLDSVSIMLLHASQLLTKWGWLSPCFMEWDCPSAIEYILRFNKKSVLLKANFSAFILFWVILQFYYSSCNPIGDFILKVFFTFNMVLSVFIKHETWGSAKPSLQLGVFSKSDRHWRLATVDVFLSYVTCRASAYGMSRCVNCIRKLIVI